MVANRYKENQKYSRSLRRKAKRANAVSAARPPKKCNKNMAHEFPAPLGVLGFEGFRDEGRATDHRARRDTTAVKFGIIGPEPNTDGHGQCVRLIFRRMAGQKNDRGGTTPYALGAGWQATLGAEQLAVDKKLEAVVDVVAIDGDGAVVGGNADLSAEPGCTGKSLFAPRFAGVVELPSGVVEVRTGPRGVVACMKAPRSVKRDKSLTVFIEVKYCGWECRLRRAMNRTGKAKECNY